MHQPIQSNTTMASAAASKTKKAIGIDLGTTNSLAAYMKDGQPVIIPGDMGTASYLLVGTQAAMDETFGTTCHGAGRTMSRRQATRIAHGKDIARALADRGIVVRAPSWKGIAEEQAGAIIEGIYCGGIKGVRGALDL